MGNCLKTCFGSVNTKRNKYFTPSGRYKHCSVDIEFENLIEDDEVQQNHTVLTEEERNHLLNRRYTDLVRQQQKVDSELDQQLMLEEENARLEEEAYNAARKEAARAAKQARELERLKQQGKHQGNGSAKSWLGENAGDWEIAGEDDFETFLESVKAKSETVRASVASMLSNSTNPANPTTLAVTSQPQPGSAVTGLPATSQHKPTQVAATGQKQVAPVVIHTDASGLTRGSSSGQVKVEQIPTKAEMVTDARQIESSGESKISAPGLASASDEKDEGSRGMSYYIQPTEPPTTSHDHANEDSDVEWEADFVGADSTPEPITVSVTPTSSTRTPQPTGSSTTSTTHSSQPIRTGVTPHSKTNGSVVANGRLPYRKGLTNGTSSSSTSKPTTTVNAVPSQISSKSDTEIKGTTVKAKKSLDIDIDKFLEELEFDT